MALIADKQHHDSRVSDLGEARRLKRKKDAMHKVSSKLADSIMHGTMLTESSTAAVSGLAKSGKPAAKVVTPKQPAPQPASKVKKVPKPKPAKAKAKKATTHKTKRTDRVAELIAMPRRSMTTVPPAEYTDRAYVEAHEQPLRITAIERKTHVLARAVVHDRYLNAQDEREITATLHDNRAKPNPKGKVKPMVPRIRTNTMHLTLERLATFESICHLTDDSGRYEGVWIVSQDNITVGGVRFTLGFKREFVYVPCTGTTNVKARSKLDRFESVKSRSPQGEASETQPLVEAVTFFEEVPSWPMYALDAVKTVADGIARGYGSLEYEFDAPYKYDYDTPKHIFGVNVVDLMNAQAGRRMAREEQIVFGMMQRDRTALRIKGQQDKMWREQQYQSLPAVRMNKKRLEGYGSSAHGQPYYSTDVDQQLKVEFEKQEKKVDAKVAANVEYYRDRFSWAIDKKSFILNEGLRIEHHRLKLMGNSHLQAHLERKEQTYPSDPRGDIDRYYEWLERHDATNDRSWEIDDEHLQYHLKHMETQRGYDDAFGIVHQCASYRKHKTLIIPKARALTRPEDNSNLDLPPTAVAPVTEGPVKVSQNVPDFLIDGGGVVFPFTSGMGTLVEAPVPSKGLTSLNSLLTWCGLGLTLQPID